MTTLSGYRLRGWFFLIVYLALLMVAFWRAGGLEGPVSGVGKTSSSLSSIRRTPEDGAIAVLDIQGLIALSGGGFGSSGDADGVLRRLRDLRDNKEVKAVILRINSPGGTVASVQEIHDAVIRLQATGKKVVASFQDVAASGGYYIAAPADRIVANPGSIVGSIGVVFHLMNYEDLAKKVGVRSDVIKSGTMKDMGSPFRPLSDKERRVFEGLVQSAYGQFLTAVSEGRNIPLGKLYALADGRVFTGEQARAEGLVDVLGGFDRAVDEAKQLAGIHSAKPRLIIDDNPFGKIIQLLKGTVAGPWGHFSRWAQPRASLEYVWE
ncbi:MAG: signal peptide peptidase SppA [Elusimicrobia bacterium]|nr:signal peptide peptidase SppA [Elusimicrobiota bacterium]